MAKLTTKEAFAKIAKLLNLKFDDEFTNAKCSDGTILKWTGELKEGTPLMMVDEAGNETPAKDMTYDIEDGSKITTVGGLVTKVEPKAADPDTASELEKAKTLMAKFADPATPIDPASLAIMMKAVMNYCFGWEMEKADRDAAVTAAITAYKQGFKIVEDLVTEQDKKIVAYEEKFTAIEKLVADNSTTIAEKFTEIKEIVSQIAEEPAAAEPQKFGKKPEKKETATDKLLKYKKSIATS